jgi:hypothetical protein
MDNLDTSRKFDEIRRIGNRAVHKAQADNHAKGLPNVYSKNGVIYWQLPDGTITMENPLTKTPQEAKK